MEIWDDVRQQFPALRDNRLVYLDSAATTQLPESVIEAVSSYERSGRGNPYRGLHAFAAQATEHLRASRATVAEFIGARAEELLFTKSTTEGLNLLAQALGRKLGPGDEVVLTIFEHHAALLPWRQLAEERGFTLCYLPMAKTGAIDLDLAKTVIGQRTRGVVVVHVSNVLGTILPVAELAELAHAVGAWCVVDAAQSVGRLPLNVRQLGCDALAFGAHKMYGPEGIGAVFVSNKLRPQLQPLLYGGGMVDEVLDDSIRYAEDVRLFEAGSPNVSGAIGFAAACKFLSSLGMSSVHARELELTRTLNRELSSIPNLKLHLAGSDTEQLGVSSFSLPGIHSHDVAQILADEGIAVRAGYHCAAPLTRCLDVSGTVRASLGIYSLESDIVRLAAGLQTVVERLKV